MSDVTRILDRVQQGDARAEEELLPLVYEELRRLAAQKMANEAGGLDPRKAGLVKLRYFVGMSFDEAAIALGIAVPTAKQ